jgi:hypothetical protein
MSFIEPLVGFLRHPLDFCIRQEYKNKFRVDKSYLMIPFASEVWYTGKAFYFDAGASLYAEGGGGPSQKWFVDEYAQNGIQFHRILAWDANVYSPTEIWNQVPGNIKPRLSYYNIPIDPNPTSDDNILNFIRALTKKEDYVVLKIDVDNTMVESALIKQIIASNDLHELIDDLYWEHHVYMNPLVRNAWGSTLKGVPVVNNTLADSYHLFTVLRKLGIRAHSWV